MIVTMQAWSTVRGKGKLIPSGGTLVIGREQDCPGGCFDSLPGAAGQTQRRYQLQGQTPLLFALVKSAGCQVKISTLGRSGAQKGVADALWLHYFSTQACKPQQHLAPGCWQHICTDIGCLLGAEADARTSCRNVMPEYYMPE